MVEKIMKHPIALIILLNIASLFGAAHSEDETLRLQTLSTSEQYLNTHINNCIRLISDNEKYKNELIPKKYWYDILDSFDNMQNKNCIQKIMIKNNITLLTDLLIENNQSVALQNIQNIFPAECELTKKIDAYLQSYVPLQKQPDYIEHLNRKNKTSSIAPSYGINSPTIMLTISGLLVMAYAWFKNK
jgi:hypothetical protein